MKKITQNKNKSVYSSGYKPKMAFDSLMKFIKGKVEIINGGKAVLTNSFYISGGDNDMTKNIDIRISDHTKFLDDLLGEKHQLILKNTETDLQLDIISSDDFKKAKELIISFLK